MTFAAKAAVTATTLFLSGCGLTYTSPTVSEAAGEAGVTVVELTRSSVRTANSTPYDPQVLPAAFRQIAGTGSGIRGAGALPEAPFVPEETPERLDLRVPPEADPGAYRIGVGDILLLATRGGGSTVEELSGILAAQNSRQGYTVRDDGAIALPQIGTVQVSGLTVEEAEAQVFDALVRNNFDPTFSLEVAEFNSKQVSVGGAVAQSILVPVTLQPLTLGKAITAAGGMQVADEEFASIRLYRDGTLYQIPLEDYFSQPDLQDIRLVDDDAVYVDTTYNLDRALEFYQQQIQVQQLQRSARQQALSELQSEIEIRRGAIAEQRETYRTRLELGAEDRDYVYLAGEVAEQSRYPLPYQHQATLADVLYDSGGFSTASGDPSEIYVLRSYDGAGDQGPITAWHLDAGNAANISLATRMEMRPNDIVFIEEQPIVRWGRAISIIPTVLGIGNSANNLNNQ